MSRTLQVVKAWIPVVSIRLHYDQIIKTHTSVSSGCWSKNDLDVKGGQSVGPDRTALQIRSLWLGRGRDRLELRVDQSGCGALQLMKVTCEILERIGVGRQKREEREQREILSGPGI